MSSSENAEKKQPKQQEEEADDTPAQGGVSVVVGRGYTVKQHTVEIGGHAYPLRPGSAFTALLWSVAHTADARGGDRLETKKTYYDSPAAYFAVNYPGATEEQRSAFASRSSVVEFEQRCAAIRADPEAWLETCRARASIR